MSILSSQYDCIFSAEADILKITSAAKSLFSIEKGGVCKLFQQKSNQSCYIYSVEDISNPNKQRICKFTVAHDFKVSVKLKGCQFTIVLSGESSTQLIGTFCNEKDCKELSNIFQGLKNLFSSNNLRLNSKENNCSVNRTPVPVIQSISSCSQSRTPLTPLTALKVTPDSIFETDQTPSSSIKKSACKQVRLFPPSSNESKVPEDDDLSVTAIGGKKAASFYKLHSFKENGNLARHSQVVRVKKHDLSFRYRNKFPVTNQDNDLKMPSLIGFSNLGNTCYMNSILQCLLNIPNFFQDINDQDNVNLVPQKSLYRSLYNLGILKYSFDTLENQISALKQVKSAISEAAVRFSGYAQHDAHEFLCQCLDQLKEDLLTDKEKKSADEDSSSESDNNHKVKCPIRQNFESKITHTVVCQNCNESVFKTEVCNDFSLVIPEFDENSNPFDQSLHQLIQFYFSDEIVEYTCEKCKSSSSILSHQFKQLPRVLILHIKRYDVLESKRCDRVVLPKSIDMGFLVTDNTVLPKKFNFDKTKLQLKQPSLKNMVVEKRKTCEILDCEPRNKSFKLSSSAVDNFKEMSASVMTFKEAEVNLDETFTKLRNVDTKNLNENGIFYSNLTQDPKDNSKTNIIGNNLNTNFEEFTTVSEDEEEDFKKALELSIRDFEEKHIEDDVRGTNFDFTENTIRHESATDITKTEDFTTDSASSKHVYNLIGVVNHHGANTSAGHYTSDSYDFKSNCWRNYNDSTVKDIKLHEVCYGRSHSAYIVFYLHSSCYEKIKNSS